MKSYNLLFKAAFFVFLLVLIQGCSEQVKKKMRVNTEFASYIGAYTSGMISKESTIQIQLTEDYDGEINYDAPIEADLFDFSPSISGDNPKQSITTSDFFTASIAGVNKSSFNFAQTKCA